MVVGRLLMRRLDVLELSPLWDWNHDWACTIHGLPQPYAWLSYNRTMGDVPYAKCHMYSSVFWLAWLPYDLYFCLGDLRRELAISLVYFGKPWRKSPQGYHVQFLSGGQATHALALRVYLWLLAHHLRLTIYKSPLIHWDHDHFRFPNLSVVYLDSPFSRSFFSWSDFDPK